MKKTLVGLFVAGIMAFTVIGCNDSKCKDGCVVDGVCTCCEDCTCGEDCKCCEDGKCCENCECTDCCKKDN